MSRLLWPTMLALASVLAGCEGRPTGAAMDAPRRMDSDASRTDGPRTDGPRTDGPRGDARRDDASPADAAPAADARPAADAAPVTCPPVPAAPGPGLAAIDRRAFPLHDDDTWASASAIVDRLAAALPAVAIEAVLADLNRTAVPATAGALTASASDVTGVRWAIGWNAGDQDVAYWIPQGLTGSPDADASGLVAGRRLALVSWYHDLAAEPGATADKGVRVSLVDVTDPARATYRHLLLVEPFDDAGRASFRRVPVHAGGIVWIGRSLYVADTSVGFRVFDLARVLRIAGGGDAIGWDAAAGAYSAAGYAYVVPQVGRYAHRSACAPRFSFVGLDRSTSPPSLVSGEYIATDATGRLFRWPLVAGSERLGAGTSLPSEAFVSGVQQLQGGLSNAGRYYLSTSQPAAGAGALVVSEVGRRRGQVTWCDAPETLVFDTITQSLWGASEAAGRRYVFAVDATRLP